MIKVKERVTAACCGSGIREVQGGGVPEAQKSIAIREFRKYGNTFAGGRGQLMRPR